MNQANVAVFVPHAGCPNQCSFCNQRSISGRQKAPTQEEVTRICIEGLEQLNRKGKTGQLAFFGGSFTAIEREYMESLLKAAAPFVGRDGFTGIRISTRPDVIDLEVLELLKSYNVTAIELGAQSMDELVLQENHRGHTAQDVRHASALIKKQGIELGLQMMTGLYKSTHKADLLTAKELAKLCPDTMRVYPTILIHGTPLEELYMQGMYHPQKLEEAVELCGELLEFFKEKGIRVIRMGLHASSFLEEDMIAGPYHPAFRELCEGSIFLKNTLRKIELFPDSKRFAVKVAPKSISKMLGQNKQNLKYLAQLGYTVKIQQAEGMEADQVYVCPEANLYLESEIQSQKGMGNTCS